MRKDLFLSHKAYVENLLKKISMSNCKPVSTPVAANAKFWKTKAEEKATDASIYKSLIKSLLYLTNIRPNIMYAANLLSKYV